MSYQLPTDLNAAADALAGWLANADPEAEAPVRCADSDLPWLLQTLMRRATVLEALHNRLIMNAMECSRPDRQVALLREAASVGRHLNQTLDSVYRAQKLAESASREARQAQRELQRLQAPWALEDAPALSDIPQTADEIWARVEADLKW